MIAAVLDALAFTQRIATLAYSACDEIDYEDEAGDWTSFLVPGGSSGGYLRRRLGSAAGEDGARDGVLDRAG
jgi:hypothetical protein